MCAINGICRGGSLRPPQKVFIFSIVLFRQSLSLAYARQLPLHKGAILLCILVSGQNKTSYSVGCVLVGGHIDPPLQLVIHLDDITKDRIDIQDRFWDGAYIPYGHIVVFLRITKQEKAPENTGAFFIGNY